LNYMRGETLGPYLWKEAVDCIDALRTDLARALDECEQRKKAQRSAAEYLNRRSIELMDYPEAVQLATDLGMLALSVGQAPLPKDVRDRIMEAARDAAQREENQS